MSDLLDRFVCVRIVQANGLDLSLFQFDFDLTWAACFLNADGTIYGRYGSHESSRNDKTITLAGFRRAAEAALELHRGYPENRFSLAGKQAIRPRYPTPESYPSFKGRYTAFVRGPKPGQTCMHCHQVHDAERALYWNAGKPIPDDKLWSYPRPETIGLTLDPNEAATVRRVVPGSPAKSAGFQSGDRIASLAGQPILSPADVQWVLEHSRSSESLEALIRRGSRNVPLSLSLPQGWWRKGEFSSRSSTWDLRRIALGGLVCKDLPRGGRTRFGLDADAMALRVTHVGQHGEHAAAHRAGFKNGDILVAFDGQSKHWTESELIAYVVQNKKRGSKVQVAVLRGERRLELTLPVQ